MLNPLQYLTHYMQHCFNNHDFFSYWSDTFHAEGSKNISRRHMVIISAGDPATQGAKASATMVWTQFELNIPLPALKKNHQMESTICRWWYQSWYDRDRAITSPVVFVFLHAPVSHNLFGSINVLMIFITISNNQLYLYVGLPSGYLQSY